MNGGVYNDVPMIRLVAFSVYGNLFAHHYYSFVVTHVCTQ